MRDPADAIARILIVVLFARVADDHLRRLMVVQHHIIVAALEEGAVVFSFVMLLVLLDGRELLAAERRLLRLVGPARAASVHHRSCHLSVGDAGHDDLRRGVGVAGPVEGAQEHSALQEGAVVVLALELRHRPAVHHVVPAADPVAHRLGLRLRGLLARRGGPVGGGPRLATRPRDPVLGIRAALGEAPVAVVGWPIQLVAAVELLVVELLPPGDVPVGALVIGTAIGVHGRRSARHGLGTGRGKLVGTLLHAAEGELLRLDKAFIAGQGVCLGPLLLLLIGSTVVVEHVPVIVKRVVSLRLRLRLHLGLRLKATVERLLLLRLVRLLLLLLSLLLLELGLRLLLDGVRRGAVRTDHAVRVFVVLH